MRGGTWFPVVDGVNLPRDPFSPDAPPLSRAIPMVVGNTHDETTYLMGRGDPAAFQLTWETLPGHLAVQAKAYIGNYPPKEIVAFYRGLYPGYRPSDVYFAATTAARSWPGALESAERRARQGAPTGPTISRGPLRSTAGSGRRRIRWISRWSSTMWPMAPTKPEAVRTPNGWPMPCAAP